MNIGGIESGRQSLLQKKAESVGTTTGSSYQETIASVLNKIEQGEDVSNSSSASLLAKLKADKKESSSLAEVLNATLGYTNSVSLSTKVQNFVDATAALLGTNENSLFIKNKATTEEAKEAFDLTCSKNGTSFTLEVKQLAKEQVNDGTNVTSADPSSLSVGRHYFDVTVDGKTKALVVKINQEDTEKSACNKVINAINNADCGVVASLVEEGDKVHISIACTGTGAPLEGQDHVFSFSQSGEETIVDLLGLNTITQEGQDAIFNFNNAEEDTTYMYNSALIDDAVSVDFKTVTDGPISVSFEYDYDTLSSGVESFVSAYNQLKEEVDESSYKTVQNFFSQITSGVKKYEEVLANIGISKTTDGKLQYNDGMLYMSTMEELSKALNASEDSFTASAKETADSLNTYMDRLTGKRKKYYGLKAKKSNAALRQLLNS